MRIITAKQSISLALGLGILCCNSCGGWREPPLTHTMIAAPPAAPLAAEDMATGRAIQFIEERVRRDTKDFSAYNRSNRAGFNAASPKSV